MDKITFTDATLKTQGYVTINGTNYDIVDTTYTGGTDLNASTFNTMQDNIAKVATTTSDGLMSSTDKAKLDKTGLFSLDEVAIGTWIDGSTIYRKVINFGALPNATSKLVNHGISNIKLSINAYGVYFNSDYSAFVNIPNSIPNTSYINYGVSITSISKTQIEVMTGTDRSSFNAYIILEYIKNS